MFFRAIGNTIEKACESVLREGHGHCARMCGFKWGLQTFLHVPIIFVAAGVAEQVDAYV